VFRELYLSPAIRRRNPSRAKLFAWYFGAIYAVIVIVAVTGPAVVR
jgi:hypothetical protein